MDQKQLLTEVGRLRMRMQADPLLNLEFLASVARLFREYNVDVTADVLGSLVLSVSAELPGTSDTDASIGAGTIVNLTGGPPQTGDGPPQTHDQGPPQIPDGPPQTHDNGPPQTNGHG